MRIHAYLPHSELLLHSIITNGLLVIIAAAESPWHNTYRDNALRVSGTRDLWMMHSEVYVNI